ncbi:MAG TPA: leucine-rich repeat domain-containing protein, partial [Polyangiaceae bacterium]
LVACGRSHRSAEAGADGFGGEGGAETANGGRTAGAGSGGNPGGTGGTGGTGGQADAGRPSDDDCGPLIDDVESGTGRICEGVEGRVGVWYAFNDEGEGATQWPELTPPGTPIPTSEIPNGRGSSTRAMHTFGTPFTNWGAGIGFDLVYDGTTYDRYDASAYSGITFWGRGAMDATTHFRISTARSTLLQYGGDCMQEPCYAAYEEVFFGDAWRRYWVPFSLVPDPFLQHIEQGKLTNVQFLARNAAFDFWVDDVSFFTGEPDCCPESCAGGVHYADSALDEVVKRQIMRTSGDVSCGEACSIYALNFIGGARDLGGLECSPGLHTLRVGSKVEGLAVLEKLTALAFLDLVSAGVEDIQLLAPLRELRVLSLAGNAVTDASPLAGLPKLVTLNLSSNRLPDLSALAELPALTSLDASYNQLGIARLGAGLDRLKTLLLKKNLIGSVAAPFDLPALEVLALDENPLVDLRGLAGAPALKSLSLNSTGISSLETLPPLPNLTTLTAWGNELADLRPLAACPSLTVLHAGANHVSTLDGITELPRLATLVLSGNELTDVSALSGRTTLRQLDLSSNHIESVETLTNLGLESLILSDNPLKHFGSLTGVFTTAFEGTTSYATLNLDNTGLTDLTELANAEGLVHNLVIYLRNNP